ncbi:hypothetical protein C7T35_02005 [Variovorax sp. WS11]|uniref:hypothetical protein n=1 Tax=Variovorax sp. WS11 TaxID=1105204 RepID=UPI000D0D294A|nr:hypothetical protein [Variovorax sp. WS11]PSL86246.1 hypothetical protein C7T35_02005 [Variovorax sp. WS11]
MSRYLCELKNLLTELENRYGERDDSVQQVKHELETVEAAESEYQGLFALGRDRLLSRRARHSWEGYSSLLHSTQRPPSL